MQRGGREGEGERGRKAEGREGGRNAGGIGSQIKYSKSQNKHNSLYDIYVLTLCCVCYIYT